ncbi:glucan endo-1,3-beta-glucosidase 13-like [Hibiscus syriacus]|nr:glucan endo-1,3-beta-glucosidase 13-like [Hibiscus syriacus]
MCSSLKLLLAVSVLLQLLDLSRGNKVGVDYGRDANNLPSPDKVAQLVQNHNIQYVRIYDTDPQVLNSFKNTGIELTVGVHNSELPAFQSQPYVDSWLKNSILPFYPATKITYITVGNEVTESPDDSAKLVVTAMKNVVSALKKSNLQDSIKVSTALSFGVLSNSFPPSEGAFNSNLAFVLDPLLEFLNENRSPFMVNIYPYFTVKDDSSLKFALFEPSDRAFVDRNGFRYDNMFDAQLDAVHFAILNQFRRTRKVSDAQLDAIHFSLADQNYNDMKIIVKETGYRTRGPPGDKYSTIDNAMTYNKNLIQHVTSVSRTTAMPGEVHVMSGTPARPNVEVDVYIFSLFNENQKDGSEIEGYWGIFNPDMTPVYNLEFPGKGTNPTPSGRSWCIASPLAPKSDLQKALDWVCGPGKADCSALQPGGGQCFEPNDLVSHASFAFNNYYQKKGLTDEACSFGGTGIKVYSDPSHGNCIYNVKSSDPNGRTWCVASRQASQTNLQTALDWACGPGKADCSSIQPNQQCFEPNTLLSHASFAFNNYYQKNGATDVSCSFHGNAIKVDKDPSYGNCIYH